MLNIKRGGLFSKLLLLLFMLPHFAMNSQTTIAGGTVSGTWSLAGSPYMVNGDLFVLKDSVFTIQEGVNIVFTGPYRLDVLGRILAVGTVSDSILFSANTSGGWVGIRFDSTGSSQDSSLFTYCRIQHGIAHAYPATGYDLVGGGFMFRAFSKARISNCEITLNEAYGPGGGICCLRCSPIIKSDLISFNESSFGNGGGIYFTHATPSIRGNTFTGNFAGRNGGALSCDSSNSVVAHNTFSGNRCNTGNGGGISCFGGSIRIDSNAIDSNLVSRASGAGIFCAANGFIRGNKIQYNQAASPSCGNCGTGAGIYYTLCSLVISGNRIAYNSVASGYGGAIAGSNSSVHISDNVINYNTVPGNGSGGGAIYSQKDTAIVILNDTINYNASVDGGAIMIEIGNVVISNSVITHNIAKGGDGGGVWLSNVSGTVSNNDISYNKGVNGGGLMDDFGSSLTVSGNILSHDSASGAGGGIWGNGIALILGNTLSENNAAVSGGGLYVASGNSRIRNNLISNNSSLALGGGIDVSQDSSNLEGCVIVNNTATNNWGAGGGVMVEIAASLNVYNCTIAHNMATGTNPTMGGGGLSYQNECNSHAPFVRNTIIWGNVATSTMGNDLFLGGGCGFPLGNSDFDVSSSSIYQSISCIFNQDIQTSPLFVSPSAGAGIGFNGLAADWSLQGSSPCIDKGDTTGLILPVTDIAGNIRKIRQIDMGAYEYTGALGIRIQPDNAFHVVAFPNPADGMFLIQSSGIISGIEIFNPLEERIASFTYTGAETTLAIDLQMKPKGIYFARIHSGSSTVTQRIVIQ